MVDTYEQKVFFMLGMDETFCSFFSGIYGLGQPVTEGVSMIFSTRNKNLRYIHILLL